MRIDVARRAFVCAAKMWASVCKTMERNFMTLMLGGGVLVLSTATWVKRNTLYGWLSWLFGGAKRVKN